MCDFGIIEAPDESSPERGGVEYEPQRVKTFGNAAAGAPLPSTQPRSVSQSPVSEVSQSKGLKELVDGGDGNG